MKNQWLIIVAVAVILLVGAVFLCPRTSLMEGGATNTITTLVGVADNGAQSRLNGGLTKPRGVPNPEPAQISAEQNRTLEKMGILAGMTQEQKNQKLEEWYRAQHENVAGGWRNPISFYGLVVDENTNSISGVMVNFSWNDTSPKGTSKSNTVSDASGYFQLTGVTGRGLIVNVEMQGYYYVKSLNQNIFEFPSFIPDRNNPVIFHLRKRGPGADLITSQHGIRPELQISAPLDGTPVKVDLLNRTLSAVGQLEIGQVKPEREKWKTATEWSYRLAISDGGFVEHNDEFPFDAPESGYAPTLSFIFRAGETNWTDRISKNYYIVFGSPRKYGRIKITTTMTTGTILEYAVNPDGTRNLEPK